MASLIADGHHLPAETFKAMVRAKEPKRVVLVSDSISLAGLPPGRYRQGDGLEVEVMQDGRISVAGTPYLAGAALSLIDCVPRAMSMGSLTLSSALSLATVNPGQYISKMDESFGLLAVGARADIVALSWQEDRLVVDKVWVAGQELSSF
jgi:N-acetylglucosamine-6-phosphate deacetylase